MGRAKWLPTTMRYKRGQLRHDGKIFWNYVKEYEVWLTADDFSLYKEANRLAAATREDRNGGAYRSWKSMKRRCLNKKSQEYSRYGGKGITICQKWTDSYEAFLADMGPRPSRDHSIDRIDNKKGYEPNNCRWATQVQQNQNRDISIFTDYNIPDVIALRNSGETWDSIAKQYGASDASVPCRAVKHYLERTKQ